MSKRFFFSFVAFFFFSASALVPLCAQGVAFQPNTIIDDGDFFNPLDMTLQGVQRFLEEKKSTLATYSAFDIDGIKKTAGEIIHRAATSYGINPKVILTLLQKEQSLIENPRPSQYNYDWATGYARCDSCTPEMVSEYKGFGTQVEKAAWRKQYYTQHPESFNFRPGVTRLVDGMAVTPANWATAALYNYTPHLRGNFSFWKLWQRYFGKQFPDGIVVKEEGSDTLWLMQEGRKRRITSWSVFVSRWQSRDVLWTSKGSLVSYEEGSPVRFPQYALLRHPSGTVFLLIDDKKYGIPSDALFAKLGFQQEEAIEVTEKELQESTTGGFLISSSDNPRALFVQDSVTGEQFSLARGAKHPLLEHAASQLLFPSATPLPLSSEELARYPQGSPTVFPDGSLVSAPGESHIYLISNGEKRPFASAEAFELFHFSWSRVTSSSGTTLALHPTGKPIDTGAADQTNFSDVFSIASGKE